MTLDFFEGAAGTGKTHNLVAHAGELVQDGILGEERRVMGLTFMNGARRRLQVRLAENKLFRRRFECQTFDVFARTLATRRRSLITGNSAALAQSTHLNEFDAPCFLAATLLETPAVQRWVAASFPLVLVDEAQDLDDYRMRVLQGLSTSCNIVAAADSFQCLTDGQDTARVMNWLETAGQTHRLTRVMRDPKLSDESLIQTLYIATFNRPARPEEVSAAVGILATSTNRANGAQDLFWGLLNSKEFLFNH